MNLSIDWAGNRAAAAAVGRQGIERTRAWFREVDRRVLIALGALLVAALGVLLWVSFTDQSRVLDAREAAALRSWSLSTQAPGVADAFNVAAGDGKITLAEVRGLMEVAKGAEIPLGLYQPVLNSGDSQAPGD